MRIVNTRVVIVSLAASSASACYTGVEDDAFGDGFADWSESDESDGADEAGTSDSGTSNTGTDTSNTSDTETSDTDTSDTSDTDTSDTSTSDTSTSDTSTSDTSDSTTDSTTTDGDTSDSGDGGGDLPDNAYCSPVADWDPQWVAWELEVIELVNQARAQGGNCGSEGSFPASSPLVWNAALTCAARVHSQDMADNNFFSHTNLEGHDPWWRIAQAGYAGGGAMGENIAAGYGSPAQTVQGWLDSDGHCANMLNPGFAEIGVGYAYGPNSDYGNYWTQTFGG